MARLSVNLNKIALLRNARQTGVPNVAGFARLAHAAGAHGVTMHPRPDQRHIRTDDVAAVAEAIAAWRPAFELNIEGYPDDRLFALLELVRPEQATFVPDAPGAFTSDGGWQLGADAPIATEAVARAHALGARAILFVDPDPQVVSQARATGADGIEIYTGSYAAEARTGVAPRLLTACAETARRAAEARLSVNVGHDLNLANIPPLIAAAPFVAEASIGHELTADALLMGWHTAIRAYAAALN